MSDPLNLIDMLGLEMTLGEQIAQTVQSYIDKNGLKAGTGKPVTIDIPTPTLGQTKAILKTSVGGRAKEDARKLWESLPGVCRRCAVCHTDFWEAYGQVIPECRHRASGKGTGQTNRIGRTNRTLRQRISGLVRKTLSFSKSSDHHIRAIKFFIRNFNLAKPNHF